MARRIQKKSAGIVFGLSVKDLKHEWILNLCLVLAIAAVLSPLMLLFGLKYGIITQLSHILMEDPVYREIKPLATRSYDRQWFEQTAKRPDVAFVIPATRQIAATVTAQVKDQDKQDSLNILPTMAGDPLLLENNAAIPGQGECVLTQPAAESLSAKPGDIIIARAGRIEGGKYAYGSLDLAVSAVLSIRASELKSIYVQLPVLEAVESYKDGEAVPEYGWPGSTPKAYPLYDGLILVLPQKLSKVEEYSLCNRTGFTKIETLTADQLQATAGFQVAPNLALYRLYTMHKPAGDESVRAVTNKLRGKNAQIFPWTAPIGAQLVDASGQKLADLNLQGLSADSEKIRATALSPVPGWDTASLSAADIRHVILPEGVAVDRAEISIRVIKDEKALTFPVTVANQRMPAGDTALIPSQLAGILNLYKLRNIKYDEKQNAFVLFRRGYAGFRLYVNSIFDVDALRRYFDTIGLPVHTEIMEIKRLIELDRGMTLIFWLLAFVGITGAIASLIASLYASVERKKREMSVLRLIGLSGLTLFRFPIYQGVLIGTAGFGISMILFGVFSKLINNWFRPYVEKLLGFPMDSGVSFCYLPISYIGAALLTTMVVSALAAMVAAMRVTQIDPAEALRDE
jgi:putative ABC transport system permease protein